MLRMFLLVFGGLTLAAQTQIDLRTQAKNIDFTAANSTRPIKTGTALPATCAPGDMFFKTDAQAGANLYGCTAANTWSAQGGISSANCRYDASTQTLRCTDANGNVFATVETATSGTPNQWVDYIATTGIPHTSQPTAAAVGAVADPGSNGIPYRNGPGTAAPAGADEMSGPFFCQDAGAGGGYACNLNPPISNYKTGTSYWFKAGAANAGAATIDFNALGPKTIVKQYNQTLAANDIHAGQWVIATYDGTNMQMQSQTANAPQGAVASVFGRTGPVVSQSGDYSTAQVTESGNLYFTNARARGALWGSGPISFNGFTGALDCPGCVTNSTAADTDLYGNFPHLSVVRLQGLPVASTPPANLQYLGWNSGANQWQPTTLPGAPVTSMFGRTGAIAAQSGDYSTAQVTESGNLYFTNARARGALWGSGPISLNASTGAVDCPNCVTNSTAADTDLYGDFPHLSVVRLQGLPVASTPPANLQYLGWNGSANRWEPKTLPGAPVTSTFGRTGAIAAQSGDYSFAQISGTASASQLPGVAMRTDQGNTVTAGTQDFSNAAHTLPMKSGTVAMLPALCAAGETYFATDAPAGGNVYGCTAPNVWSAQGNLSVKSGGFTVGTRGSANFITGAGLMSTISDDGSEINIQSALDTAVVQTQPGEQSGSALLCASSSGSASQYKCSLNPTLAAYTNGMVLHWKPDVAGAGGATTLNIDTLGTRPLKATDGVSDPAPTDIAAGKLYNIWYDGSVFRLVAAGGTSGGGAVASVFGRTGSIMAQSGDYTTDQVTEGGKLYFTNARAWAALSASSPIAFNGSTGAIGCATCLTTGTTADTDLSGTFPHLSVVKVNGAAIPASGVLKANGSSQIVLAAAGADYAPATSGTSLLKGNGSGGFSGATAADIPAALSATTSVNGTPIPASSTLMTTGTAVQASQMPALSGDCTSTAGSTVLTCTKPPGTLRTYPFFWQGAMQAGVSGFAVNLPASGGPAPANTGGTMPIAVLEWAAAQSVSYAWWTWVMPAGYTANGPIAYSIESRCNAASCDSTHANIVTLGLGCVGGAALDAPTIANASPVNITNGAAAIQTVTAGTLTPNSGGLPACAAGNRVWVKMIVDTNTNSPTGPFDLVSAAFSVQGGM